MMKPIPERPRGGLRGKHSASLVTAGTVLLAFIPLFFQSCTMVPTATSALIERKINNVSAYATKGEVIKDFGVPHYQVTIPQDGDVFDIWGYDMGNYWYNETGVFFFKNDRLAGIAKHPYEMLKLMRTLRIIDERAAFSALEQQR